MSEMNMTPARKRRYDREYATQFYREVEYLKSKGILPTYTRTDNGISTWKFARTPELLRAAADFYEQQRNERAYNQAMSELDTGTQMHVEDLVDMLPPDGGARPSRYIFGILGSGKSGDAA